MKKKKDTNRFADLETQTDFSWNSFSREREGRSLRMGPPLDFGVGSTTKLLLAD
jgi:hypothetical protein